MKLLKLVHMNASEDEKKSLFYTKGCCTISERAAAHALLSHFHSLSHAEQVRYLSEFGNKRKILKADKTVK
jgi:hypothetical protein